MSAPTIRQRLELLGYEAPASELDQTFHQVLTELEWLRQGVLDLKRHADQIGGLGFAVHDRIDELAWRVIK